MELQEQFGYVVSDLHHFAERSQADAHMPAIRAAAAQADFFVLNGDVFDFQWTVLDSVEQTIDAAVCWLRELAADHPRCRFVYVLGNHDALEPFVHRLDSLAAQTPNLEWRPSHHRDGSALFLHGDLPSRLRPQRSFRRRLRTDVRRRGRFLSACYRVVTAAGLHRWVTWWYRPRRRARKILRALAAADGLGQGVTDVYFGHTHEPFSGFEYGGVRFHNTGSAVRGHRCDLLAVRTPRS